MDDLRAATILGLVLLFVLVLARTLIRTLEDSSGIEFVTDAWSSFYDVAKLMFGEFGEDRSIISQSFSVTVATLGFMGLCAPPLPHHPFATKGGQFYRDIC